MNFVWFDIIYIYLNTICEYIPQYLTRSRRPHDLMKLFLAPSHCPCHCVSWNSFFGRRTGCRRTPSCQELHDRCSTSRCTWVRDKKSWKSLSLRSLKQWRPKAIGRSKEATKKRCDVTTQYVLCSFFVLNIIVYHFQAIHYLLNGEYLQFRYLKICWRL